MILSNHILSGALVAEYSSNLWLAFPLGVAAHLLLDSIPHWDYSLENLISVLKNSPKKSLFSKSIDSLKNKEARKAALKIVIDIFIGLFFSLLLFLSNDNFNFINFLNLTLVIFGTIILDLLIIPSKISNNKIINCITKVHTKIFHTKNKLKKYPYGLLLQILTFLSILFAATV